MRVPSVAAQSMRLNIFSRRRWSSLVTEARCATLTVVRNTWEVTTAPKRESVLMTMTWISPTPRFPRRNLDTSPI